jgi:hypothetical protein
LVDSSNGEFYPQATHRGPTRYGPGIDAEIFM